MKKMLMNKSSGVIIVSGIAVVVIFGIILLKVQSLSVEYPKLGSNIQVKPAPRSSQINDLTYSKDVPINSPVEISSTDKLDSNIFEQPNGKNISGSNEPELQTKKDDNNVLIYEFDKNTNVSFADAFSDARLKLGAEGIFLWKGEKYTTVYAEEIKISSQEDPITVSDTEFAENRQKMELSPPIEENTRDNSPALDILEQPVYNLSSAETTFADK